MNTPEEILKETQLSFDTNLAKAQRLEQEITKLQEELRSLQLPLAEDQGAIKKLKQLVQSVKETV
tara:strand:+ start:3071 stop:3265 length:195 start_codon:yes stop_codon:yes gene_type:complete